MFLNKIRNIFCVPDTKSVSATNVARAGKRGNVCVGNNVSETMCTRLPGPLRNWFWEGKGLLQGGIGHSAMKAAEGCRMAEVLLSPKKISKLGSRDQVHRQVLVSATVECTGRTHNTRCMQITLLKRFISSNIFSVTQVDTAQQCRGSRLSARSKTLAMVTSNNFRPFP